MQSCAFYNKILFLFIITITTQGYSQLSKTHYIPPLTSAEFGNATPEEQYIYISTPSTSDISYTIKPVGQPTSSYITGNVSNTNAQELFLENGNGQLFIPSSLTSTIVKDRGYIIEAEAPIYVSVRMNAGGGAQAGALVSKGLSALGTTFRVGSYTNQNPQDNYLNFVSVMATEDNTQVTFSDLPAGLIIKNYSSTIPVSVDLNKGESYTIATNSSFSVANRDGLIGCLVSSDKDIVVNCGSANGSFHNGPSRDYGLDQIVGLNKVGKEYIFVKGDGENGWENILIVAHTNNTSISINGNASVATINAGDYYLIEGNEYNASGNMYVETSEPVFAYQGVGATNNEANQGLFFVPPLSCEARGNLDNIANIERIGFTTYNGGISVVTKVGATVTINNNSISSFSTIGPSIVDGNPNYVTYKVTGLFGNISVQSTDELYCAYFNFNGVATSGSFYSGFPSAPEINFDTQFQTLGNCIPNIELTVANAQNFDSYAWYFDDGSGYGSSISTSDKITPTQSGKYKLIGTIACTGATLESVEVPVSICPDDIDNDGIIDNIDIDNDNDGILNCTESRGDVTVNITNTNQPQLIFQDNSINTSITAASFTQNNSSGNTTNTITGTNMGGFTSIVQPASSAESTYSLSFTESVNVKFMEDLTITHIATVGESFIAKISPVNKNMTLIDPDNRLLIDSNFDGVFETGVAQISGSEIHYKINPSPLGNTPYQFFANQVDGFSFIHKLSNTTTASSFSGIISLTCFKKDTDLDGIKDELDLDSDNDGLPDLIENEGTLVTLSNIDVDANGLDDIFNINAMPLDTDADTIFDFYDLDSDNDGIYDLIESGQLGTLSDTNLDGIEDGPTYGINGWADAAETTPDSNIIGYTPNDLDNDSIFTYLDLDSDGDTCSDVIEAGFSDANGDDLLGDNVVTTNMVGKVNNASDGYTIPNSNYLDFAPISITTQPIDTEICELTNAIISLVSSTFDIIQWEVSTDGINWNTIVDNTIYMGSQTADLNITNTPLPYNTYHYRAFLNLAGNSCGLYSDEIELTVHPLPILNTPNTYSQCDDASNDGMASFNLTLDSIKEEIDPDHVAKNLIFSYYLDSNANNPIPNPQIFQNSTPFTPEIVWIGVEDSNGCFSLVPITLEVTPSSAVLALYNPNSIYQCDDGLDDRDGVSTFDLSNIKNYISTTIFSTFNVTVHFYESQLDAELETNEILDIANHQNTNSPNTQDIWVRVKSDLGNNCLGLEEFSNLLIVEALPFANPISPQIECDNDIAINNGMFPFDTTLIETTLLNGQSLTDVTVNFTYLDIDGITVINSTTLPNPFLTSNQIITVRVTNNNTLDPDGACYDETTIEFRVDLQPIIANQIPPQIVCDGNLGDLDDDGVYPFDTSTFSSTILGTQAGMEIYFDYVDENGTLVIDSTSLPNPLISENQTIVVEVINPANISCTATTNIELVVNPLPEFTINPEEIVCTSDPTFTVLLDPIEASVTESFIYEWVYEDGTILSNDSTLTVSTPGTYSITLTKTDGTGCSRTLDVDVKASEKATITPDDVTIVDLSENNSVTIDPTNLGLGDYEYALREEDAPFIVYQEEPVFNNVKPGFYTIYIRDAICGVSMLPISVIGYAKYFTPNGDNINDYWKIKGLNATFQPNSAVLIYDRYGKSLKQLTVQSGGWDGTFNGALLPTDDYWFKVFLQDGREFSGHFTLKR